jgi:hypothetical protein
LQVFLAAIQHSSRRVVSIAPSRTRDYQSQEWSDTLVLVERGEVELEHLDGRRYRFGRGAVLFLIGFRFVACTDAARVPPC